MKLKEFIQETTKSGGNSSATKIEYGFLIRPAIICKDGFKMSVQGSRAHYCDPRKISPYYNKMEIGYPSQEEPLLIEYAEQPGLPTDTVYGYVPTDIIDQVIEKHGGIDIEKTFITK